MAMSNLYSKISQKPAKRIADLSVSQTNQWVNGKKIFCRISYILSCGFFKLYLQKMLCLCTKNFNYIKSDQLEYLFNVYYCENNYKGSR